jgi:uncharacterized protein (TIGR04255 family)
LEHSDGAVAEPRHLDLAPITEAIIDVRVKSRASLKSEDFRDLVVQLPDFPVVEERRFVRSRLEFQQGRPKAPLVEESGLQGFFVKTPDARTILQLRPDGYSLNRLAPYSSWDELFPVAWSGWEAYRDFATPAAVTRLAVRFINHIRLPADLTDFDDYLVAAPKTPDDVPPFLSGFFSQVVIHHPDWGVSATVRQSLEIDLQSRVPTLLLDIDSFRADELDVGDDDSIRGTFRLLHDYKNLFFFGSLTERTLELFK